LEFNIAELYSQDPSRYFLGFRISPSALDSGGNL
jgi:hypothetical protein